MMRNILLLLFTSLTLSLSAQRIIPLTLRWENAIGFYGTVLGSTALRIEPPADGAVVNPRLGYGGAVKFEYVKKTTQRFVGGGGIFQRNYTVYIPEQSVRDPEINDTIRTTFLNFFAQYKFLNVTLYDGYYFAPGLALDIELNHPIINRDASGVGVMATVGYERRFKKKKTVFFIESDVRLLSLWHFKQEEYPWRHATIGINMGLNYILN